MGVTRWKLQNPGDPALVRALDEQLGTGLFAASILAARGYTVETAAEFLGDAPLHDPFSLKDMDRAVAAIERAIDAGETIAIYGDYDADGVSATAILYSYLENLDANVVYYIPKRDGEGYGLNRTALQKLANQFGVRLIITVDTGITAIEEAAYCRELGVELVITDHHQPTERLPDAAAVVDPHRADDESPYKTLCGAGVALKLICALERDIELAPYYADLAAIGTVGDVVPLTGENRTIVKQGLERLGERERPGIEALRQVANVYEGDLTAVQLAFTLVPRINAAGRMGSADSAVNLLLSEEEEDAAATASAINSCNTERKSLEAAILESVEQKLLANPKLLTERLLIVSGSGWHHGVVGIVAAKLVERYGKPCILLADDGLEARASARSIEGFSLFHALCAVRDRLVRFGGHAMAAGFTVRHSDIEEVTAMLQTYAATVSPHMPPPVHRIDRVVSPSELTLENIRSLSLLEPFGTENESPQFLLRGMRLDAVYPLGQTGGHCKLKLTNGRDTVYTPYFGVPADAFPYQVGEVLDVLCSASINVYQERESVSVRIIELRLSGFDFETYWKGRQIYERMQRRERLTEAEYAMVLPEREDVAVLYRYIRQQGTVAEDYDRLSMRLPALPYCRLRACAEILRDLKLCLFTDGQIRMHPNPTRADIETSRVMRRLRSLEREERDLHGTNL